ncbi:septum formation family protein [Catenulispora pinisilvae]|uniref:septum formation family protein n=1 Tax=Catenulispora pinisilvae TaxID=2705253 RepID=UPI001892774D|nr:septum formation family protein [Catenulispora pinisilvae]
MTEPNSNQQPYQGIPGSGGPHAPVQDQVPYGAQSPYGQQQPQYGGANPYAAQQPTQNSYGAGQPQNPYGQGPQNPYGDGSPYGALGPAPRRKRRPVLLYIRLGVLVVILIGGGVSWLITNSHKAHRDAGGSISKSGNVDAIQLRAGDCYEKPSDLTVAFSSIKAVPCTQPHDSQAFFSFTYPGATSVLPGDDDMKTNAEPRCEAAAKTAVDATKVPDNANLMLMFADDSTWSKGHHDILCAFENDSDYTGSLMK